MSNDLWLTADEQRAWRGFLLMGAKLQARLNRELQRRSGLSDADYEVLVNLSEAPGGRLRAFELCGAMHWEKSRLSHHLSRMEARGLVVREGCRTDARGAFVSLTGQGRAAIEAAAPEHVAQVRRLFFDALTPEQVEALTTISEAVLDRLAVEDRVSGRRP
jgi:DNA-binding MarR family transcriptional regulator